MLFAVQTDSLLLSIAANLILFFGGFWMLVKGSDIFVDAASNLARCWKVPELVIGLTLVSIGTSLPELASSAYAAFCNQPDIIVGNIAGSNVVNILLILGSGIVCSKAGLTFHKNLFTRDTLLMNLVFIITIIMTLTGSVLKPDGTLSYGITRWCGLVLFLGALAYCRYLFRSGTEENEEKKAVSHSSAFLLMFAAVSLVMVIAGSKLLVDTIVWGANRIRLSPMLISVTVVAFGTSVPELAVTISGVRKGLHDLVIGNIVGSCIFNVLMIFGICAVIRPLAVIGKTGMLNMFFMLMTGLILLAVMALQKKLSRLAGSIFLFCYVLFVFYNVLFCGRG